MPLRIKMYRVPRLLTVGIIALAGVLLLSTAQPASAEPHRVANQVVITNAWYSGLCLTEERVQVVFWDRPGTHYAAAHDGTPVKLYTCNMWSDQGWTLHADGTIRNTADGLCLDEDISSRRHDGTRVQVYTCNGWPNQKWLYTSEGQLRSDNGSGDFRCLDEVLGRTNVRPTMAEVQLRRCVGPPFTSDLQVWAVA